MKEYFLLQKKRAERFSKENGLNFYFAVFLAIALFLFLSVLCFEKTEYAPWIYSGLALWGVIQLGEIQKNDFLQQCFSQEDFRKIRFAENILLAIPFCIFLLYKQAFVFSILLFFLALIFSFYNTMGRSMINFPTPFGKYPFEFLRGFRMLFFLFPLAYVFLYFSIQENNFNLGLFSILYTTWVCASFYYKSEEPFYIWNHSFDTSSFLFHKIKISVAYTFLMVLPLVMIMMFYNWEQMHLILLVVLIGVLDVVLFLLSKYSYYPKEVPLVPAFLMVVSIIFPPLLLFAIPFFYLKSIRSLNPILK